MPTRCEGLERYKHVAWMDKRGNKNISLRKHLGNRAPETPRIKWEDNTRMNNKHIPVV
jgi:hypothetical protein